MKARATLLALAVGACALAQGVPARPEQIAFQPLAFAVPRVEDHQATLKNAIPVFLAGDPKGVPFVRITVLIRGGSYLDPKGKEGLAALAGDLLRNGGTEQTGADALDARLEFLAGKISSQFGDTHGSVAMEFMEKDLQEGLDLFMQVLTRPAFAQARLEQAKEATLQEFSARNDQAPAIAWAEMARLLNGEGHFSAVQPTAASIQALTREDLLAFQARLLHPGNLVVAVSGRFQRGAMLERLNQTLGALKPGPKATISPAVPAPALVRKPGIYMVDKDIPQSVIRFALPGLRRTDPDWTAAQVMNQILGGSGFTSRLMKKIRSDEGLTYGISTAFGDGPYWKGNWGGSFQTKNQSVAYALRLVLAEVERIKAEPVPAAELKVIQDSLIQAFPSQCSKKQVIVASFAQNRLIGWPENTWLDYRERVQAVTVADVQRVARKYLDPSQMVFLVVGKAEDAKAGDGKDHPGLLKDLGPWPLTRLPLRDPLTLKPLP